MTLSLNFPFAKTNEDALQIVEQILPYFQPHFTMTVNLVKEIGEKRDIPVILDSINMQDDYEGNFDTRRTMVYTMNLPQTYLFGPVPQVPMVSSNVVLSIT